MPMTDRLVRLLFNDHRVLVVPPNDRQPFAVPHLPVSQLIWLDRLAEIFHDRHDRCLCVALMLDLTHRLWARPEVPTQRCGRDGVRWSWEEDDFGQRSPNVYVGGSYQSARLHDLNEAASLVPPTDGVHLIGVRAPQPGLHAFVHVEGQTMAIEAKRLVVDDVYATLETVGGRLTLE